MPYFAPPGGSLTARVARSLQDQGMSGVGFLPDARMPRSRRSVAQPTMTGMGLVLTPKYNYSSRYSAPASVTFAAVRAASLAPEVLAARRNLSGLGVVAPRGGARPMIRIAEAMPTAAGVLRQAAMFMSPGGGYSQIPGFMPAIGPPMRRLSFLGQEEPTTYDPGNVLTPPDTILNQPTLVLLPSSAGSPSTYTAPTTLTPPPGAATAAPLLQNTPLPALGPGQQFVARPGVAVSFGVPGSFMNRSTLGVPNKYLAAAAAGILLLTSIGRRRRRNPSRKRRRRA